MSLFFNFKIKKQQPTDLHHVYKPEPHHAEQLHHRFPAAKHLFHWSLSSSVALSCSSTQTGQSSLDGNTTPIRERL